MEKNKSTYEADRIHFAVLAIEAGAKKMDITPAEMRRRLQKQKLIEKRLLKFYDLLHTQSLDWVGDDIVETLHSWEATSDNTVELKGGNA